MSWRQRGRGGRRLRAKTAPVAAAAATALLGRNATGYETVGERDGGRDALEWGHCTARRARREQKRVQWENDGTSWNAEAPKKSWETAMEALASGGGGSSFWRTEVRLNGGRPAG
ncbi:hypothetical protein SAMD00023353_3600200 [Rosellinia necatrix]|uniref:Uncharacterized protein n=1 Tax=Rosellinia necatrix TaxID=77044 RepID=A0A1S8A8W4_ROSNE|nr:hypothetical protein SAMD00023353_3600200 [Rosellinia necatrix]